LPADATHIAVSTQIPLGNIGDRHQSIQRTEPTSKTEHPRRFFFHPHVQIDLVGRNLGGQDFDCLEEIQVVQSLKTSLQRGGVDDILFVDSDFSTDDVVSCFVISVDIDLPDPHHLPFFDAEDDGDGPLFIVWIHIGHDFGK
jgi:hypothetical protein